MLVDCAGLCPYRVHPDMSAYYDAPVEYEDDGYGYVYPLDDIDELDGALVQYSGVGDDDGNIEINDTYWEDDEEWWEEVYPETWIPYSAEPLVPPDASPGISVPQNSQQVIIGAIPGLFPDPTDLNAHFCDLYPEICAARGRRGLPTRDPGALINATLGEAEKAKMKALVPILKHMNYPGLGLALVLILVVLLALNLGWDSEVNGMPRCTVMS